MVFCCNKFPTTKCMSLLSACLGLAIPVRFRPVGHGKPRMSGTNELRCTHISPIPEKNKLPPWSPPLWPGKCPAGWSNMGPLETKITAPL